MPSGSMFSSYQPYVVTRLGQASPLAVDAMYTIHGDQITLTTSVSVDLAISGANNQVHFFVAREGYHGQSNLAVAMLASESLTLTTPGQSTLIERTFTANSTWLGEDLRLIVVAQNMVTKEVYQAALATANYVATVVVDCEPDGVLAPWHLQGPDGLDVQGEGDKSLNLFSAGEYTLTWLDVPLWTSPSQGINVQTVLEGETLNFFGQYSDGPFTTVTAGPLGAVGAAQGASAVDFDHDGDLDLHVVFDGAADQLLRNDGGDVFTDVAAGPVADAGAGRSAAWADFNRDGFPDLYLARYGQTNLLLQGDGGGGFTPALAYGLDAVANSTGAGWVDYDSDGVLDLYTTAQGANSLLRSMGDLGGGFFIFSPQSGLTANLGNTRAGVWTDGDLDGRLDLYMVNGFSANVMLENTVIGFNDVSSSSGLADVTNGTGAAWGDLDNDGDFDLYLTNDGMADKLFSCNGNFLYTQIPGANLGDTGHGRGVAMVDLDNDMFLDIYVVRTGQPDLLLMNNGDWTFGKAPVGPPEADGYGNTLVAGDFDQDGAVDLFITRVAQSNVLLKNFVGKANHWFAVELTGDPAQPDAIGARVVLTAGGVSQTRLITGGGNYQAMNSSTASFGLAQNTQVDLLEIHWPDGTVQTAGPFPADRRLPVTKGEDPASPAGDDQALPRATVLGKAYPNPFNPSTTIAFALAQGGPTRLEVFDLNGRLVKVLRDENLAAGSHEAVWTGLDQAGRPVASGAYFYRLRAADGSVQSGRMVLVK